MLHQKCSDSLKILTKQNGISDLPGAIEISWTANVLPPNFCLT